jgi:hypothetical protein
MNPKKLIGEVIEMGHLLIRMYVSDLTDAELLVRSVPGANHAAWQLGHLVAGVPFVLDGLGRAAPELPEGFEAAHSAETAASDYPAGFLKKDEYLALFDQMKAASLAAVDETPDEQLDLPGSESMREYAATVASALMLLGMHPLMHAGQLVPIRRKLGKPAMI